MNISELAIITLKGSRGLRDKIKDFEGCSPDTVNRWIRNKDSVLTKAAILDIIKKETGLTDEQILEEVAEPVLK